jgi:hypothetical protein
MDIKWKGKDTTLTKEVKIRLKRLFPSFNTAKSSYKCEMGHGASTSVNECQHYSYYDSPGHPAPENVKFYHKLQAPTENFLVIDQYCRVAL